MSRPYRHSLEPVTRADVAALIQSVLGRNAAQTFRYGNKFNPQRKRRR